ncbi:MULTISPECIES: hypothetical protein [Streptomyces]|uniref:hypothetical protein n=1 Tax=Streptomyces TaxID=1883 RepID=UPI00131C33DB|nr:MULTISPECIES: hypothetical protein [Streptomyces]MCH0560146.1 hypothetical protein [Streptomyces sp. MUM 16J]
MDINDRAGKAIYKVLSQPCETTGIQKITFGSPAEPKGFTVRVTSRNSTQYALLLTQ